MNAHTPSPTDTELARAAHDRRLAYEAEQRALREHAEPSSVPWWCIIAGYFVLALVVWWFGP